MIFVKSRQMEGQALIRVMGMGSRGWVVDILNKASNKVSSAAVFAQIYFIIQFHNNYKPSIILHPVLIHVRPV